MRKTIICIFASIILTFTALFATACDSKKTPPKTGEAQIVFPEDFYELANEPYHYRISPEYYNTIINFRDYVTVNDETTWILSKTKDGSQSIVDFSPRLRAGANIFYVICSDRIGISNTYKIEIYVKRKVRICYYLDFDYESTWKYATSQFDPLHTSSLDTIYWNLIMEHKEIGYSKFWEMAEGIEFSSIFPSAIPQKEGYSFNGWEILLDRFFDDIIASHQDGIYLYHLYVATWKPINNTVNSTTE